MLLSVAEVATLINLGVFIVQFTLGLGFVLCLVSVVKKTNSAITWSNLAKTLHSSLWPTILCTDSASRKGLDRRISYFNGLVLLSWVFVAIAGVITPLGLNTGRKEGAHQTVSARYVKDDSNVGKSMSPRDDYRSGRFCGQPSGSPLVPNNLSCPGQDIHSGIMPPNITNKFSAEYSTLTMQFRNFYNGIYDERYANTIFSLGHVSQTDTFILREGIFAIEAAVVDMGERPGIGLLNYTFPAIDNDGATWKLDVLWLEPVTECTNTNLTLEFTSNATFQPEAVRLVDHGGFWNLTEMVPPFDDYWEGQKMNLWEHSFAAAARLNDLLMDSRNLSRGETFEGFALPMNATYHEGSVAFPQFTEFLGINPANFTDPYYDRAMNASLLCTGYGGANLVNMSTVEIYCSYVLGAPDRLDHGDPRRREANVNWYQPLHVCASATKLAIQTLEFSYNGTEQKLSELNIKREPENIRRNVLWGMENLDSWTINNIEPVYGKVNDEWEYDPDLHTIRSDRFYTPAGTEGTIYFFGPLQASSMIGYIWSHTLSDLHEFSSQYDGSSNSALLAKWQSYYQADPDAAPAKVANLIFTDRIANNLVGTAYADKLNITPSDLAITYDTVYAIPAFIILSIWGPVLLYTAVLLLTGKVKLDYLRYLLNQTSVGRIIVGDSYFRIVKAADEDHAPPHAHEKRTIPSHASASLLMADRTSIDDACYATPNTSRSYLQMTTKRWVESGGKTLLTLSGPSTSLKELEDGTDNLFALSVRNSFNQQEEANTTLSSPCHCDHLPKVSGLDNDANLGEPEDRWRHTIHPSRVAS